MMMVGIDDDSANDGKKIPQISWFTAWLALDESRIQSGRNRCLHHFQFGSEILLNCDIHQPVQIAQK